HHVGPVVVLAQLLEDEALVEVAVRVARGPCPCLLVSDHDPAAGLDLDLRVADGNQRVEVLGVEGVDEGAYGVRPAHVIDSSPLWRSASARLRARHPARWSLTTPQACIVA